jgi:hypothetical protein
VCPAASPGLAVAVYSSTAKVTAATGTTTASTPAYTLTQTLSDQAQLTTFGSTNLAPGASTTFTVRLDAKAASTYGGKLSFGDIDNSANGFSLTLSGVVTTKVATRVIGRR